MYFAFEGIDGSGKSTQIQGIAECLEQKGYQVLCLREPGSTQLSEGIREILLNQELAISPRAEVLLFSAARAQLIAEVVKPALEAGKIVLSDRSYWSTLAYQGYARNLPIEELISISEFAVQHCAPQKVFLMDLDPRLAAERRGDRQYEDRIESEGIAFLDKVRRGFLSLAHANPQQFIVLDATKNSQEISGIVLQKMLESVPERHI